MESCNLLINNGWLQLYCNNYFVSSSKTWPILKNESTVRGAGEWPRAGGVLPPRFEVFAVEMGLGGGRSQLWQDWVLRCCRSAYISCQCSFAPAEDLLLYHWESNSWKADKSHIFFSIFTHFPPVTCRSSSASPFTTISLFLLVFSFWGCWHCRIPFAQNLVHVKCIFSEALMHLCSVNIY